MHPDDAELVRVYTREKDALMVADVTFSSNQDIEVTVEAEAGSAIFAAGGQFELRILVRDLTSFELVPLKGSEVISGSIGEAWQNQAEIFTFKIPVEYLKDREDHIMEVLTVLKIGIKQTHVSFARSPLFLITAPQGKLELISSWNLN